MSNIKQLTPQQAAIARAEEFAADLAYIECNECCHCVHIEDEVREAFLAGYIARIDDVLRSVKAKQAEGK